MTSAAQPITDLHMPADLCTFGECHCSPAESRNYSGLGLRLLGSAALLLALVGLVVPLLPTTPFLLVATWAFARSSPRLDAWLRANSQLGPLLAAWEERRAIPRHAKAVAVIGLSASWLLLASGGAPLTVLLAAGSVMLAVGIWILRLPS